MADRTVLGAETPAVRTPCRSALPFWGGMLAGLTLLRLLIAALLPVTPDEAYYWVWSRHLQAGYLDHPPLVALCIRLGTIFFGPTALGIRLLTPLLAAAGTVLTAWAACDFRRATAAGVSVHLSPGASDVSSGVKAGVLLNATLAMGIGSVTMTPDTPLLFFAAVFLWALGRLLVTGDGRWWLFLGLAAGLGFDSKYTMALPVAGLGLWCLVSPVGRTCWRSVWLWAGALVAALCVTPVFWWNATHGWASFVRQGARTGDWRPGRAAQFLGELLGGQIGLLTPGLFLLAVLAVWRMAHRPGAANRALTLIVLVPLVVFVQHAFGDRVQANWPVILYPFLVVAVVLYAFRGWRPAACLGLVMGAVVVLQAVTGLLPLNRHVDVTLRQGGGWTSFAREIREASKGAAFVMSDDYGLASELALRLEDFPVLGADARWRFFGLSSFSCTTGWGLLVRNQRRDFPVGNVWKNVAEPVGSIARARGGREAERYALFRVPCSLPDTVPDTAWQLPAGNGSAR